MANQGKPVNTYGVRRRFKGKTVLPTGQARAHTPGGSSRSAAGFECGQPEARSTKQVPAYAKVQMPVGTIRLIDPRCGR